MGAKLGGVFKSGSALRERGVVVGVSPHPPLSRNSRLPSRSVLPFEEKEVFRDRRHLVAGEGEKFLYHYFGTK